MAPAGHLLFLTAYNLRKKVPSSRAQKLDLASVPSYVGFFSIAVFIFHTGTRAPRGPFLILLYGLFCAVVGAGFLDHHHPHVPRRMAIRGEEVIFERIPQFRRRLNEQPKT